MRRLLSSARTAVRAGQGRPLAVVLMLALALALLLPVGADGPLPALRLALFDAYQVYLPRARVSAPVLIVAIDEASLAEYGQWPWPRTLLTALIGEVAGQQPLAIGLDILMPEPDNTSPEALARRLPEGALRDALAGLPAHDAMLAARMRAAPVVLGAAGFAHAEAGTSATLRLWPVRLHGAPLASLPVTRFPQAMSSLPMLQQAARGQGLLSVNLEKGVVRRVPLLAKVGDTLAPSLSLELLRVATGVKAMEIEADAGRVRAVTLGDLRVPTEADGTAWVNYSAPAPERYISALDMLRGRTATDALRDKIVVIATTGLGLADYKTNARGDLLPGADTHAQLIESFFDGALLRRPSWMAWAELAAFGLCGGLTVWLLPRLRLRAGAALVTASLAGLFSLGAALFAQAGCLFDAATVTLAYALICVVLLASMWSSAAGALRLARDAAARTAGELNAARRIQMASLPQARSAFPGERRFALDALLEPARAVGGDLYDFFMLDQNRLFFMVGDVSGKGLPASLFMVVAKALSRSIALRGEADMTAIMNRANRELARENPEMLFVTSVAGILDASTGELVLCNAGHDAPRRIGVDGCVEALRPADGPPLCVMEDFDYPVQQYQLRPGECLCLTTDGVTEAMNAAGELYGQQRLDLVLARADAVPEAIVAALRDDVGRHVDGAEASDDLTLLVLRWNGAR